MTEVQVERLQKMMAASGVASRRECEKIILQGRVTEWQARDRTWNKGLSYGSDPH